MTKWRKSSYSESDSCVEIAKLPDGRTAVRNSNHPDAGTLTVTPAAMATLIEGVKAGDYDDLA